MIRFECDRCGAKLGANDSSRFIVKIEAYAAAGPVDMSAEEISADHERDIRDLIDDLNRANPDDVEDQVYRSMRFDLCAACYRAYLKHPLG